MSLSTLVLPTKHIKVGKSGFEVRGLTFSDITLMIKSQRSEVLKVVDLYVASAENGEDPLEGGDSGIAFIQKILSDLPEFVAHVIATASDEPENWEIVKKLPIPVLLQSIMYIGELTFEDDEGLKKFLENIIKLLGTLRGQLEDLASNDLMTGMGFSDDK